MDFRGWDPEAAPAPAKEVSSKDIAGEVRATLGEPAKERVSNNGVEN